MSILSTLRSRRGRRALWGYLFISPWIIGFFLFDLFPIASTFYLGLTKYTGLAAPQFIGLANYNELFRHDKLFPLALSNTAIYVAMRVPAYLVVGLILALLVHHKLPGRGFFRTALYLPTIVPYVTSVVVWMWLLNYQYGVINAGLKAIGLPALRWFGSPATAKPSIVLINLWGVGGIMVIFLSGLQDIPQQLYESAEIDGANWLQKLFKITLPMLSPVIFYNLVMTVISSFQVFTAALIATGGGPLKSTLFYVLQMYREGFSYLHLGYASAMGTILFIVVLVFTLILFLSERRWVAYDRM